MAHPLVEEAENELEQAQNQLLATLAARNATVRDHV